MSKLRFHLTISAQEYLAYYAGEAETVSTLSHDGRRIEFPAEHLRPFVNHGGIQGLFEIEFDENRRFVALRQLN